MLKKIKILNKDLCLARTGSAHFSLSTGDAERGKQTSSMPAQSKQLKLCLCLVVYTYICLQKPEEGTGLPGDVGCCYKHNLTWLLKIKFEFPAKAVSALTTGQ